MAAVVDLVIIMRRSMNDANSCTVIESFITPVGQYYFHVRIGYSNAHCVLLLNAPDPRDIDPMTVSSLYVWTVDIPEFRPPVVVFSERVYMLSPVRLSSVCLSVTFVRPTQAAQIFGNISTALGTLAIRGHPLKIVRRSSQGNPSAGGVEHKRGSKI